MKRNSIQYNHFSIRLKSAHYILILLLNFSISSCKQQGSQTDKFLDQAVIGYKSKPIGLNPIINVSGQSAAIMQLIFLTPTSYNPKTLQHEPILLESLPKGRDILQDKKYNGKYAYDIQFKNDLTWDDGSPITINDYIFSMKCILNPSVNSPRFRAFMNDVVDIIPKDDNLGGVVITEKYNLAGIEKIGSVPLLQESIYDKKYALRQVSFAEMANSTDYKALENENISLKNFTSSFNTIMLDAKNISGCGPYKLSSWDKDHFIKLIKKENHWTSKIENPQVEAKPNTLIYTWDSDMATSITRLKNGELDFLSNVPAQSFEEILNDNQYVDRFRGVSVELPRYFYIGINTREKKLTKEVRQALQYLVNIDTIVATMEYGKATRINGPFIEIADKSKLPTIQYSPISAIKTLDKHGWKDTNKDGTRDKVINNQRLELDLDITVSSKALGQFIALLLKQNAEKVGIKINIKTVDGGTFKKNIRAHDFDLFISASTLSLANYDPYTSYHTDNIPIGKGNNTGFGTSQSDKIIEAIRSEPDDSKRSDLYIELEKILRDEVPIIFLYAPEQRFLIKKEIDGVFSIVRPGYFPNTFEISETSHSH